LSVQTPALLRRRPKGYWHDIEHRKAFFEEYAKHKGFDPLDAKRWKETGVVEFMEHKVTQGPNN